MASIVELTEQTNKLRKQRNGYARKCKYLQRRLTAKSHRVGQLKQMLNDAGIDWKAEDEKRQKKRT